jgi:hypothetical protein
MMNSLWCEIVEGLMIPLIFYTVLCEIIYPTKLLPYMRFTLMVLAQ